mmetsp:Transcript_48528/g.92845  ORF Transcript_48528/g.92845 Transcript_48528/m.92845 type:complete len:224 (-) Transcript_48528:2096-2767(-)
MRFAGGCADDTSSARLGAWLGASLLGTVSCPAFCCCCATGTRWAARALARMLATASAGKGDAEPAAGSTGVSGTCANGEANGLSELAGSAAWVTVLGVSISAAASPSSSSSSAPIASGVASASFLVSSAIVASFLSLDTLASLIFWMRDWVRAFRDCSDFNFSSKILPLSFSMVAMSSLSNLSCSLSALSASALFPESTWFAACRSLSSFSEAALSLSAFIFS